MLNKETMVKITNRDNGYVGYTIPDANSHYDIHRSMSPGQTIEVPFGELETLMYVDGGEYILKNLVRIDSDEAVKQLLGTVEPEYHYSADDVKKLLTSGSIDELKDCLDFAPDGVIELIKQIAVDIKLDSKEKCKAITNATEFDVESAIKFNEMVAQAEKEAEEKPSGMQKLNERRVKPEEETQTKSRRVAPPKYEVIKK